MPAQRLYFDTHPLPWWVLTDERVRGLVGRETSQLQWHLMARFGIPADHQVAAVHFVGYGYALAQLGDWPIREELLNDPPPPAEARIRELHGQCCTYEDAWADVRKQNEVLGNLMGMDIDPSLVDVVLPLLGLGYGAIPRRLFG